MNELKDRALVAACEAILRNPACFNWQYQGFGMLRVRFGKNYRLQVWDGMCAVPFFSRIHDHPWSFSSVVVAGRLTNVRYDAYKAVSMHGGAATHWRRTIRPGEGLQFLDDPVAVRLAERACDYIEQGQTYTQRADELHDSRPARGTVTLIERVPTEPDVAHVCYPVGHEFVSAEPRPATRAEIHHFTTLALETWFIKD